MRTISKVLATAGVTAVAVASFGASAMAEPTSTPADNSIVSVGSDTIQALNDQFQSDYPAGNYFSYDASGASLSATIPQKTGCQTITRPNGSSAGIKQLAVNEQPSGDTSDYCIDLARSSRAPVVATDPHNLAFVPIAGDAVTWSSESATNLPVTLTTAQLTAIYTCNDTALGGSGSPVTENEIGGTGTDPVVPVLPQSSSGTRSFFLGQIQVTTPGACVVNGANSDGTAIEENEGTNEIFGRTSPVNTKDIVFPYSIAVDLSQTEHGHGDSVNNPGSLDLREVNKVAPTTGKAMALIINKKFPYQRQVFLVTRSTGSKAKYVPAYLQAFLGVDNNKGYVCSKAGLADDVDFGFLSLGSKCGKITATDLTATG